MNQDKANLSGPPDHHLRMARARLSLDGLSVGDAFGQRFFCGHAVESMIARRGLPAPPWQYTDDTEMALAIVEVLDRHGRIEQDALAEAFARRYGVNPWRGYGGGARSILESLGEGTHWRTAAGSVFGGMGSMGNGGAMRVGPVGAYWADDYATAAQEARASAEVTHAHAEGQAGAIAVAVAAAWASRYGTGKEQSADQLLHVVIDQTPAGHTRRGLEQALALPPGLSVQSAASILGNGSRVTAPDTVPFALWCAACHIDHYEEALWTTVSGLGDRDTTCAIVGSVVALAARERGIPPHWLEAREEIMLKQHREEGK